MKLTFISNFMNHHQLPFCLELVKIFGDDFIFLATTPIPVDRINLGYEDLNSKYSFVKCLYDSNDSKKLLNDIFALTDTFIVGSANRHVMNRLDRGKHVFFYRERLFKNGI